MEAVAATMDFPATANFNSPANPTVLSENITHFELLLASNRNAKFVWAHAGWDNTGQRSVALMRQLLTNHSNLYMNLKYDGAVGFESNRILDSSGVIKSEWLTLLTDFSDRFMFGADHFYAPAGVPVAIPASNTYSAAILSQLSSTLAAKIGFLNAIYVYRL
jgi:hypothetical protein